MLSGGKGGDEMIGRGGNDQLRGDDGDDLLIGGNGNDLLNGGRDNDILEGGPGRDSFVIGRKSGNDTIRDFVSGKDFINVRALQFDSFDELLAALTDNGLDSTLQYTQVDSVTINNVLVVDLGPSDFLF